MIFPPIVTKHTFQTSRKCSDPAKISLQSSSSVYVFEGHPRSELRVAGRIGWQKTTINKLQICFLTQARLLLP